MAIETEKEIKIRKKIDDLNERSGEVKDILGQAPNWVIQWGISVVFISVILILIGSSILSYNDIIPARITITSKNPPVYLETRTSGRLTDIYVQADEGVQKDQVLAVIENTANIKDVLLLKTKLDSFVPKLADFDSLKYKYPSSVKLGQIQASYNTFRLQYQEFLNYYTFNPEKNQIANLRLQLNTKRNSYTNTKNQLAQYKEELVTKENLFNKQKSLYSKGVISEKEFLESKNNFSSFNRNLKSVESSLEIDQNSIYVLNNALKQAAIGDQSSLLASDQNLEEAKQNLENQIFQWEQLYLIKSPIEGTVTLFDVWNTYQNVNIGETLFTVVPNDIDGIIGRVTMPVQNSGKVKVGQNVIVKLDNYPFQEWGSLKGTIHSISAVPKQGEALYTIFIDIESLNTSFDKTLEFKQEMQGTAEIVLEELTVLQRIFYQLREVLSRN